MSDNRGALGRFFSGLGKILNVTRAIISGLISLVFILFFIIMIATILGRQELSVPEDGALRVELNGHLVDQRSYVDPISGLVDSGAPREFVVRELIEAVQAAAEDERISTLVLLLHNFQGGGTSKINELGEAIARFRESGKPVIAISDNYSQQQYLLASYASEVVIHPMGLIDMRGFAAYQPYLGEALTRLSVNLHVFRTGEYKDAVEPLIATGMSEASREQNLLLLEDVWQTYSSGVIARRGLSEAAFTDYVENFDQALIEAGGDAAQAALDAGLVDAVMPRDESLAYTIELVGPNEEEDFYSHINVQSYYQLERLQADRDGLEIGLIVASGTIYDGTQNPGAIGGDSLAYLLRQTREHEDLEALILRVDSPGGSAFASELIRRELELFRQAGIPVVVSMGSVAASGGYWIATAADRIVATPATVTGSIGVFALFPTLDASLERLGIYSDGVKTAPLADAMRVDRPLDPRAAEVVQTRVDFLYDEFLQLVSTARSIPVEELDNLASGRVWTGNQALERNLVDTLGNQQDAERIAAELAGLDNYQVRLIEPPMSFAEQLVRSITRNISTLVTKLGSTTLMSQLAELFGSADPLAALELTDPQNLYLHCGLCVQAGQL